MAVACRSLPLPLLLGMRCPIARESEPRHSKLISFILGNELMNCEQEIDLTMPSGHFELSHIMALIRHGPCVVLMNRMDREANLKQIVRPSGRTIRDLKVLAYFS